MKTETYDYSTIDEAIERLQKLKAEGKNPIYRIYMESNECQNSSSNIS